MFYSSTDFLNFNNLHINSINRLKSFYIKNSSGIYVQYYIGHMYSLEYTSRYINQKISVTHNYLYDKLQEDLLMLEEMDVMHFPIRCQRKLNDKRPIFVKCY